MKTLRFVLSALFALSLGVGSVQAAVLPADATNNREIRIFRNVSGASTTSGTGFVLQDAATDANVLIGTDFGRESSLGLDVTTTTAADDITFVGVQVDDTCIDDGLCRVVTQGAALARWAGDTDNTNTRLAAVGTTTVAGNLGSGTNAGVLLSLSVFGPSAATDVEFASPGDNALRWVWVSPSNGD